MNKLTSTQANTQATKLLFVDDDAAFCQVMTQALHRRGFDVVTAHNSLQAREHIQNQRFDRAIVDLKLGDDSGLALLPDLKTAQPEMGIVVLTGYSSIATAVEAIKRGATNYLCKPTGVNDILAAFDDCPKPQETVELKSTPPSVERLQWEHIQRVLQEHGGNISATARALNMHRRTLQRKLQKRPVKT